MYVLSQDKKQLINCDNQKFAGFQINKAIGKKGSYSITDIDDMCVFGKYEEEKQADLELQRLADAIKNGEQFYEMR